MGRLPFWYDLRVSPATVLFALGLTVLGSAIAGVMPALKVTRGMGSRLKQAAAGAGGLQFGGVWTAVIVAQVAVTVAFPGDRLHGAVADCATSQTFDVGFADEEYLAVQIETDAPIGPSSNARCGPRRTARGVRGDAPGAAPARGGAAGGRRRRLRRPAAARRLVPTGSSSCPMTPASTGQRPSPRARTAPPPFRASSPLPPSSRRTSTCSALPFSRAARSTPPTGARCDGRDRRSGLRRPGAAGAQSDRPAGAVHGRWQRGDREHQSLVRDRRRGEGSRHRLADPKGPCGGLLHAGAPGAVQPGLHAGARAGRADGAQPAGARDRRRGGSDAAALGVPARGRGPEGRVCGSSDCGCACRS